MNTLTLKELPDNLASSGNSLLSMIMQLAMSIGVTLAGLLLGAFGHHAAADSEMAHETFIYTALRGAGNRAARAGVLARAETVQ